MSLPRIEQVGGQSRLLVDDQPYLILGVQWDCDSCFSPEEMNPLFPQAARMGANTAVLPTYWREIEPFPGQYDFRIVNERIANTRASGMRAILLWFATWKNACPFYAPDDIRHDSQTYRRALDRNGQPTVSLCPTAEVTWKRDRDALIALMTYLRDHDDEHTIIMIQIENESGLLGTDRCYCPECNARFEAERWKETWNENAAEAFSAACLARYIDRLAGEAKAIYNLPTYTNVWLAAPVGSTPGSYPSGGALPHMLDHYRSQLQHLDFVAPDIYSSGYGDFSRLCRTYSANGNPLYIAEHSSSPIGRAERNVFYAIGQFGAIGFDPWAIDSPFPEMYAPPLVDPVGYEWGPQAYWLRDSYVAIGRALTPIVEAQGSDRLFTFVQEMTESSTGWTASGCDLLISYHDRDGASRGMVIQRGANEFLLIGVGFSVRFRQPNRDEAIAVVSAEWGRFEGDQWKLLHPMRRERLESVGAPITLLEPGVARIILDLPAHNRGVE